MSLTRVFVYCIGALSLVVIGVNLTISIANAQLQNCQVDVASGCPIGVPQPGDTVECRAFSNLSVVPCVPPAADGINGADLCGRMFVKATGAPVIIGGKHLQCGANEPGRCISGPCPGA